jgi:hypothetical protein
MKEAKERAGKKKKRASRSNLKQNTSKQSA